MTEIRDATECPRDFTSEPASFGQARTVVWKTATSRESGARLLAAQWQHVYAVRMRQRIVAPRTLKWYATEAGTSYDRLGKLLRGVIVMRLEDLAMADMILGEISGKNRE